MDGVRLAVGTLSVLPVRPPSRVDARVGGAAMTLAPAVGLVLGVIAAGVGTIAARLGLAPFLCAVLAIAVLAALTRALHLDGLADTADGLGSRRRGADALAVMARSDIGPFGVVTLMLVLAIQLGALTQAWADGHGPLALIVATVVSRAMLAPACLRDVPAAKRDGLGSVVASTLGRVRVVTVATVTTAACVAAAATVDGARGAALVAGSCVVALAVSCALLRRCVVRFGGVTGDVLGACVEASAAAALVVVAVL